MPRVASNVHEQSDSDNVDYFEKDNLSMKEKHLLKELEVIKKREQLPLSVIKKLQTLHIKLVHEVPPQHERLTRSDLLKYKKLFEGFGPIRKGTFSPAEDNIIKKNWSTFCQLHDWDLKNAEPFLKWRHDGKCYIRDMRERQKFVQFLANGLPWRTLHNVYSRFKVLYCHKITGIRYSSKEDKKILMYIQNEYFDQRDTKYTELAQLLGRTTKSVIKRYHDLKKIVDKSEEKELVKLRWTLPLIKKFITTLLNVTISEDVRELKYAILPKSVWQKMEQILNIPENVLKRFWQHQLHLQLFSTGPIYLNDIKIQLIEYMYEKGISNTREIIWSKVTQHFDGATAPFLCKVFFYLVQECDIDDKNNFIDVIEYLYHNKIPEILKAKTDKHLPRIIYKDDKIDILNSENSMNTIRTDSDALDSDDNKTAA